MSRKAASRFRLDGVDVVLAKVDGPSEPRLSRELGVHGFPSFHWYAYGRERKYEGGRRNDSMVEWVSEGLSTRMRSFDGMICQLYCPPLLDLLHVLLASSSSSSSSDCYHMYPRDHLMV